MITQLLSWMELCARTHTGKDIESRSPPRSAMSQPLLTRARLQTRRGLLDEASATLQTLWTVAETCGLLQHIGPAAAALGEHAALHGGAETAIGPLRSARRPAIALGATPLVAELGFWLDRLGEAGGPLSPDPAEPYGLLQAGDWRAAARIWEDLGFPYERARTLAEADDADALGTALEIVSSILDKLGVRSRRDAARQLAGMR